ncbi:hypothetical protein [Actinoplanes sp. NPDC051494]|uniref:hypothetical protein n=1 Tax=Actinoplanes sp. NPDC051494 TaxID=3363907 RepID=UPI0037BCB1FB
MPADREISSSPFAGELFLTLAAEGRLTLDPIRADEVIAGLERTLSAARARLRVLKIWHTVPAQRFDDLPGRLADDVVDAVFAEQLAPGRLEEAVVELPKYIEALRRARRLVPPADAA